MSTLEVHFLLICGTYEGGFGSVIANVPERRTLIMLELLVVYTILLYITVIVTLIYNWARR